MITNFIKALIFIVFTILTISCSKSEDSNSTVTNQSSTFTNQIYTNNVNTRAKFTVQTPSEQVKSNYIVMMFEQPFSPNETLPPIIKQVTTDSNGIAYFDLNAIVTSATSKKYYFEVFTESGSIYTLKTTFSRFDSDFSKGSNLTTTLLVEN